MALIKFGLIVWFVAWGVGLVIAHPPLLCVLLTACMGLLFLSAIFDAVKPVRRT